MESFISLFISNSFLFLLSLHDWRCVCVGLVGSFLFLGLAIV